MAATNTMRPRTSARSLVVAPSPRNKRSAAEELETGKEELQSVNEELTTVNQELKVKIDELSHAHNDFQNLMASYDAPAYVRRARGVQEALEGVLARCRAQRDEWLSMVRLRVGELKRPAMLLSSR